MYSEQWRSTIRHLLEKVSLREAGRLIGMHPTQVGDMRRDGWVPSAEKVKQIAHAFQVPEKTLLEAAGYSAVPPPRPIALADEVRSISHRLDQLAREIGKLQGG